MTKKEQYKQIVEDDCFGHFYDDKCVASKFFCEDDWNCSILAQKVRDGKAEIITFKKKKRTEIFIN